MKTYHPFFRAIARAGPLLVLASTAVVVLVPAQTQGSCPPIVASILPKNAAGHAGQYFPGEMSSGRGSADLSFDNPICPKQKFSARISIAFTHYGGETAILIKTEEEPYGTIDREAIQAQTIKDATSEIEQRRLTPNIEKLGIGEIVYGEFKSECPPEGPATAAARVGPMIVPNVMLKGMAWTGNANLTVTLEGTISVDLAKAAVAEVFANLQKADFSKAH
jgi:hypothetical protein